MRYWNLTWALPATAAVGVIWAFSAIANYDFGLTQGTNEPRDLYLFTVTSAQASGMAALAVDLLKAVLPAMIVVAWVFRQWSYVVGGAACFVLCLGFSSMNSLGFALTSHVRAADARSQTSEQWAALKKTLETTQKQRDLVPEHRPAAVVEEDIKAKKADGRFAEAKGCGEDLRGVIVFCRDYRGLLAEKAAADSAVALDAELKDLRRQLDSRKAVSEADPMAGGAAALLGWSKEGVTGGRSIWLTILVETLSALGWALVWGTFAAAWAREPAIAACTAMQTEPAPQVATIIVPAALPATPPVGNPPEPKADDEPREPPPSGGRPAPKSPRLGDLSRKHDAGASAPAAASAAQLATVHQIKRKKSSPIGKKSPETVIADWIGECVAATGNERDRPSAGEFITSLNAYCDRERLAPIDQGRMTSVLNDVLQVEKAGKRWPRNSKERIWPGYRVALPAAERLRATA
jgi:hypothetical protein